MSKFKTCDEVQQHKTQALQKMSLYIDSLINSKDQKECGKADKLCYWVEDWTTFLDFEPRFSPLNLRRYKRGEIVKAHLGFNIGSEEGGLHYAVVLDKNNAKSSPVVTIIPLTSVKPCTDLTKLKSGSLFLGNEIFTSLNTKISATSKHLFEELASLKQDIDSLTSKISSEEYKSAAQRINNCQNELDFLNRMRSEVSKMRIGSIALVNQITTISKIRIYDPKTDHDILSNIKLSNEKLDLIDNEIKQKFTNI